MTHFIIIVLACYNITQIITEASIFKPVRRWLLDSRLSIIGQLVSCFLCTSVWISFLLTLGCKNFADRLNYSVFINTMFISAVVWFIHIFERRIS